MTLSRRAPFLILPLLGLGLVLLGFRSLLISPHFSFSAFLNEVTDPVTLSTVLLTLRYSVTALLLSWILSHFLIRVLPKGALRHLRGLLVVPGFFYALVTLFLLRALGVQDRYSLNSVLIAWVLAGVPYLILLLHEGLLDLDPREREALQSLGANRIQEWFYFDFMRTLPLQVSGLLQQFWLYLTSFSIVMILSGGPPNETLEVAIYTSMRLDRINLTHALGLAFWQGLILVGLRLILKRKALRVGIEWSGVFGGLRGGSRWKIPSLLLVMVGGGLFIQDRPLEWVSVILNSILLSGGVVMASLAFSLSSYFAGLGAVAELGAWVSPILVSLGVWQQFGFVWNPLLSVTLIQSVLFAPWIARSVFPMLKRVRVAELEAAESLGASPRRAWLLVEWPRIRPALFGVLGLIAAFSLTEVTTVMLFSRGDFDTLSSFTQNLFSRFRIQDAAFGFLIMLGLSYLLLWISEELG